MELYKYTSVQNGINILTNLEIRFTQPNALNDVFEMFPHLLTDISDEVFELLFKDLESSGNIEELWENALDDFYKSMAKKYPYIFGNKEVADNFLKKLFNESYLKGRGISELIFQFIRENPDDFQKKCIYQFIEFINSNVGVLSLSELNSDNRLWGNYANSHSGVVICFDKSHPFFRI
ncbi:MAG: hypothetical protein IIC76_00735 [Bacteroidetes bacterium]|nr:hypothetical protein [Bacteroidota bacterium]